MRIPSGTTDQVVSFVAVDSTDFTTRETALTTFTVYRSRNGGTATAMTAPTVTELDATNMPGVYTLLLDEDMTIGAGNDSEEMVFHITQASMAPVTRTIELYRPKITAGETIGVSSGAVSNVTTVATLTGHTAQTGDSFARLGAPAGASVSADIADVKTDTSDPIIDSGTAQSATSTTLVLRAAAAFADDELIGATIVITGGTAGVGQSRVITDYVSTTDTATVDAWTTTPTGTITYTIFASAPASTTSPIPAQVVAYSAAGLADLFDTNSGTTYASAVAGSVVKEIADNAGGSALTEAGIADAVWDELQSGHVAAGSFGEIATEIASILVDTAEIGTAGAGLTNINLPDQTMNITGNITGNLSGSVGSVTGHTPQTGDSFARLGAPAGLSVSADIAAIEAQTDDIGAAGAGLTAVPWNAAWDVEVQSECTDALNAYDPPTKAENDALLTTALTESYNTDGSAPTVTQALMGIYQMLTEKAVSGTTVTVKKLDGTTTAMTLTLDDGTSPTSITRAT